jgi:hypothetical protein
MPLVFNLHTGWNQVKMAELFSLHADGVMKTGFLLRPKR